MRWVPRLGLTIQGIGEQIQFPVERLFNGGYAGRDQAAVQKHVDELAEIGVPAPTTAPPSTPWATTSPPPADPCRSSTTRPRERWSTCCSSAMARCT